MKSAARKNLISHLSTPRFARYEQAAGSVDAGHDLYEWNSRISGAFFESIHGLEIALRNAMAQRLQKMHTSQHGAGHWYDDPGGVFNPTTSAVISAARRRARAGGQAETYDKVIAELSFGFWRFLLAGSYQARLWVPTLNLAFPGTKRKALEDRVAQVHELRNRIAHHEPIYDHDLEAEYDNLLEVAERLSVRLAWWIDKNSRVERVMRDRP